MRQGPVMWLSRVRSAEFRAVKRDVHLSGRRGARTYCGAQNLGHGYVDVLASPQST